MDSVDKFDYCEIRPGIVSVDFLARMFNLTNRRIQQLAADGIIPRGDSRGEYVLTGSVRGYVNFLQKDGVVDEQLTMERLREEIKVLKGKNRKQDRENDHRDNLLVDVEDCYYQMGLIAKSGLRVLESLPDRLEKNFNLDAEIIIGIEKEIDVLRHEWADYLEGAV